MGILFPRGSQGDIPAGQTQAQLLEARKYTRHVREAIPRSNGVYGQAGQFVAPPFPGVFMAKVNQAITACNTNSNANSITPGTGTCDIYYMEDPTSVNATADPDRTNTAVINWYNNSGTINTNTHITVCQSGNFLVLLGADC